MDPALLSSNWKILHARLSKSEADPASLKRKRANAPKQQEQQKKRVKLGVSSAVAQNTIPEDKKISHKKKSTGAKERGRPQMNGTNGTNGVAKHVHISKSAPSLRASRLRQDRDLASEQAGDDEDEESAYSEHETSATKSSGSRSLAENKNDRLNEGVSQTAIAGKYIALDCEMVGYGPNPKDDSQLARVSLVNYHGEQIYDSFVTPQVPVTDYRTHITGLTPHILKTQGRPFKEVQKDVQAFLGGRVLVGHALKNDLDVLMINHSRRDIRDTSRHANYRAISKGKTPALRNLAKEFLGVEIQMGVHSSVEDARTAMLLYRREKDVFEAEYTGKFGRRGMENGDGGGGKNKKKRKGKK
jgi:RNA exonuclease 4